jgi:hypothetical protein
MIKPTKYKSISYSEAKVKEGSPIDATKKAQVVNVLETFIDLFKLKHL